VFTGLPRRVAGAGPGGNGSGAFHDIPGAMPDDHDQPPFDEALMPRTASQAERMAANHWRRADSIRDDDPAQAALEDAEARKYRRAAAWLRRHRRTETP
jgi:hypothetical protein